MGIRAFEETLAEQRFDGLLELLVLGGVDERVGAAVGEHGDHAEVVEVGLQHGVVKQTELVEKEEDLVPGQTQDETGGHDRQGLDDVPQTSLV